MFIGYWLLVLEICRETNTEGRVDLLQNALKGLLFQGWASLQGAKYVNS